MTTHSTPSANDLECRALTKRYGAHFVAVDGISFSIPRGSFFSILGPSGCGKTTLLRMLAGFASPDAGDILIDGRSVLDQPPNKRPVNLVFQHLALFPMMNVAQNIGYGLKRRGALRKDIDRAVSRILARVGLPDAGEKRIDQLSGGQKQRIAIARCMVLNPTVLLLDEPLGALDLKLREHMKIELKQLQHEFGTTFVYITHDQSEALVMSDRVAVMNQGRFEQVAAPDRLYHHPRTAFVAGFVGDSNRLSAQVTARQGGDVALTCEGGTRLCGRPAGDSVLAVGDRAEVFIRPEAITVGESADPGGNVVRGVVGDVLFNGAQSRVLVALPGGPMLLAQLPQGGSGAALRRGDAMTLGLPTQAVLAFKAEAP